MTIKETNIGLKIFINKVDSSRSFPELILVYADDTNTAESSIKIKYIFLNIVKETKKVGLTSNEEKTKYIYELVETE